MPKRIMKKRPTYKKSKYVRRARRGGQKLTNVNSSLKPFASRYITKHKYSQTFNLTAGSPVQQFLINSLYDPDLTGTGHQPMGYDQLATIYNRYRVISCSYVINFYHASQPVRLAVIPSNSTTIFSNVSEIAESSRARFGLQMPGGAFKTLRGKVYLPSLLGRTKSQYMADDRFQAAVGSSPNEQALLTIREANMLDASIDNVNCTITLEFLAEWFDAAQLAQS